jgi:hypothetical protein
MKSMKKELLAAAAAAALVVGGTHVWAQSGGASGGAAGGDTKLQGQSAPNATGAPKAGAQAQGQGEMKSGQGGTQMQGQGGAKTGTQTGQSDKNGMKSQSGQAQQPSGDAKKQQSTESKPGATDKPAQLSSEQRTKISSTIKSSGGDLKRVDRSRINFNINVGTVVPRTIGLVALPAPIVAVVPAYRGYLYIVVDDELLIVHPRTYEIVAVIPA